MEEIIQLNHQEITQAEETIITEIDLIVDTIIGHLGI